MSIYTFSYVSGPDKATVTVRFDDTQAPFIENVVAAFEQFLLGVTFQPGSINRFINTDILHDALTQQRRA